VAVASKPDAEICNLGEELAGQKRRLMLLKSGSAFGFCPTRAKLLLLLPA